MCNKLNSLSKNITFAISENTTQENEMYFKTLRSSEHSWAHYIELISVSEPSYPTSGAQMGRFLFLTDNTNTPKQCVSITSSRQWTRSNNVPMSLTFRLDSDTVTEGISG
jgi:hypothetical protein